MKTNTNLYIILSAFIVLAALISVQQMQYRETRIDAVNTQGVMPIRSIKANAAPSKQPLNILFIGNSYTFFYDVPGMMLKIAQYDKNNAYPMHVRSVTYGGKTLTEHWNNQETRQVMNSQYWDIIVLQEQSLQSMYTQNTQQSHKAIREFYTYAKPLKTQMILFKTWPRQPNSDWYRDPNYAKALRNAEYMYARIDKTTKNIASRIDIGVSPIADYWYFASLYYPDINLYSEDATHASIMGSYLTALIFYKTITGNSPQSTSFVPYGIPQEEAATLRKIAAQKL